MEDILLMSACYLFVILVSGVIVGNTEKLLGYDSIKSQNKYTKSVGVGNFTITIDAGWIIGKLENLLIVTLVFLGEYTAIGMVVTAKSIFRISSADKEILEYYLLGSFANWSFSIFIALMFKFVIETV